MLELKSVTRELTASEATQLLTSMISKLNQCDLDADQEFHVQGLINIASSLLPYVDRSVMMEIKALSTQTKVDTLKKEIRSLKANESNEPQDLQSFFG